MYKTYYIDKKCKSKYLAKGLCSTGCGNKLFTKTLCDECRKRKSMRQNPIRKGKRRTLVDNGFCAENCGKKLSTKWYCRECANKHIERGKIRYRANLIENRAKALAHAHKRNFGGLRPTVLDRDKYSCQICGYSKKVIVHHIDENPKIML